MQLIHGKRQFGERTASIADELLSTFYRDHKLYYPNCQDFTLHLHAHFPELYRQHGSLSNVNTFAHEDLIGYFSRNKHGTRGWGDLLTYYFNVSTFLYLSCYRVNMYSKAGTQRSR